jgi:SAM-dependent methyltransferase
LGYDSAMPKLSTLPAIIREVISPRTLERELEPEVMEDHEQVSAYADAGRTAGGMAAAYLFHTGEICKVIAGRKNVVDLACGPGTLLAQIAELNPDTHFTGVDLSAAMLESAKAHVRERGIRNVDFSEGDITRLNAIQGASADAVICTMALHHLPTYSALESCFSQIKRILRPGGAVYIADFTRLKNVKSVVDIAYANRGYQPYIFSLDTERSIRAAFLLDEFDELARRILPENAKLFSMFMVPLFILIKTEDHPLDDSQKQRLKEMRRQLPKRFRGDLDDMRFLFRLGGLKGDPFVN